MRPDDTSCHPRDRTREAGRHVTAIFYYDLGSPYAYLAAERIDVSVPARFEWMPVLAGGIFNAIGKTPWPFTAARATRMAEVAARARARGIALRWPEPWPSDCLRAMRAATYAHTAGRGKRFAVEALRVHFAEGRPLDDPANIAIAAERAGLNAAETLATTNQPDIKARLRLNTERALANGIQGIPSFAVAARLFWGDDQLEAAAAALRASSSRTAEPQTTS